MNPILSSFLHGLLGLGPILNLGLLPSSYLAMVRRPPLAIGYALAASFQIILLAALGLFLDQHLIRPHLLFLLRPLLLLISLWAIQWLLRSLFRNQTISGHISYFNQGCLVLGTSLYLVLQAKDGMLIALAMALGWSFGLVISTMAICFIIRKMQHITNLSLIAGWPALLIILSFFWLATNGLLKILP